MKEGPGIGSSTWAYTYVMLISAIGGHAMFLQHVGKHCIGLHARLETSQVRTQKAQTPMRADMVVDSYVMRPDIVIEWALTATDVVHLPTIDGHTFVESDQTHHLPPILIPGQTVGMLTRFIDHGESQLSDKDVSSTRYLAGSQKGHPHGLSSQGGEGCLILAMFGGRVFLDITSTLFQMFCYLLYSVDVSLEEAVRMGFLPLLIHKLQLGGHIHVGIASSGKIQA